MSGKSVAHGKARSIGREFIRSLGGCFGKSTSHDPTEEKFGLFEVQAESPECCVDIIAVHGLGGHFEGTWTWKPTGSMSGTPCNWLKDLLPSEIPNARILSFGYNSAVQFSKSIGDISMFANQLLQRTLRDRRSEAQRNRPIIFVAHGLGGLVVKKAILDAHNQNDRPNCSDFLKSIKGIVFMGTPHKGSGVAEWGSMGAEMLKAASLGTSTNTALLKELKGGKVLEEISVDFIPRMKEFPILSCIESEKMDYLDRVIVTKESARLYASNEIVLHMNGNHSTICKFPGRNEDYKTVSSEILDLVNASRDPVSQYISALRVLATEPKTGDLDLLSEDTAWFFQSSEFNQWIHGNSERLWLSGGPRTGKTLTAFSLWDRVGQNHAYNESKGIAFSTCKSPAGNTAETAPGQVARILSTFIVHLSQGNEEFQEAVNRRCRQLMPLQPLTTSSLSQWQLEHLWKILSALIIALPSRQTIIIVDGLDEISSDGMRGLFLKNLLSLHTEVCEQAAIDFKIFITSKPSGNLKSQLEGVPNTEKDKERQECLRSLKFDGLSSRRDRVGEAVSGTGEWLAGDKAYQKWEKSAQSSLLQIRGKPGSGKSTLAKHILGIKMLKYNVSQTVSGSKHDAKASPKVLIADFFYSVRGGKNETNHKLMLQSILFQLLSQDADLFPLFQPTFRAQKPNSGFQWQHQDLKKILSSFSSLRAAAPKPRIYIILDAMDESTDRGRPEILTQLQALCSSGSNIIFKCLVATRPLPAREIDEEAWETIILEQKNKKDIQKLIRSGLNDVKGYVKKDPGLTWLDLRFAKDYMTENAEGVFRWVSLVIQELKELASTGPSQKEFEDKLRALPRGLDVFYQMIIDRLAKRVNSDGTLRKSDHFTLDAVEKGVKMLNWVTFAERPLTVEEFQDAIAIPSFPKSFTPNPSFLANNRVSNLDARIKTCCGPLIEIRASVVQLLHLTAREFLLRQDGFAGPFDTDVKRGDTEISSCCIRYLRLLASQPQTKPTECWKEMDFDKLVRWLAAYPLLGYVLQYLSTHLRGLGDYAPLGDDFSSLSKSFQNSEVFVSFLGCWTKTFSKSETITSELNSNRSRFKYSCLSAAAKQGLTAVVESMIHFDTFVTEVFNEKITTALQAASLHGGDTTMAELLLQNGADVNAQGGHYGTALQAASSRGGDTTMAELLLRSGADVNAQGGHYGTALQAASSHGGDTTMAELLLRSGADVNAQGGHYGSALQAALSHRDTTIVELLLRSGADVNAQGGHYGNALQAASWHGKSATVELLLRSGADVNAQGGHYGNALQAASSNGDTTIAELLLCSGADVNAQGGHRGSAIQSASANGYTDLVDLFLSYGADLGTRMHQGVSMAPHSRHRQPAVVHI